jgi:hypothetical protein
VKDVGTRRLLIQCFFNPSYLSHMIRPTRCSSFFFSSAVWAIK